MGAERHHYIPRLAAAANRKKSPGRHKSARGEGCHSLHPSQGALKDRHPNSVRPVCGGSAPKRRPRTSIRGQVGHDAHPKGRHSKDGHPQPQPASWQAFGQAKILSRIPEPRPETLSLPETQSVWSAVTNRLMLAGDGRSLQIDLVGGYWAIPVSDIPGSRESGASAPVERAPPKVSGAYCFLWCRQDGVRWSLRAGA
jgi:hypothetical protein